MLKSKKQFKKELERIQVKKNIQNNEFYNLRPILGHFNYAMVAMLLGGRGIGKSYSVTNYFVDSYCKKGIPFTWLRLTDKQAGKLLQNNAENLVDPDLRRKYNLDIVTSGNNVYQVTKRSEPNEQGKTKILEKKLMARVFALSNFYNQKGSGLFDNEFLNDVSMQYHVCLDEFEKEENERSQGNILYQFVNQMENLIRCTKERVKVFIIGNYLESCADIMSGLNFIPEEFGIYKLKKKRTVVDYQVPSDADKARRKGSFADLFMPQASTFTNKIDLDRTLITKQSLTHPVRVIKFTKNVDTWFTVWNNNIVCGYKNEQKPVTAMRPFLDELYDLNSMKEVFLQFDSRSYQFRNLITFSKFQKQLELLKPSR